MGVEFFRAYQKLFYGNYGEAYELLLESSALKDADVDVSQLALPFLRRFESLFSTDALPHLIFVRSPALYVFFYARSPTCRH